MTWAALGAAGFGAVIGWYVYYVNRYRKGDVQLSDLTTLIAAIGGAAITSLFSPTGSAGLFGAYGAGLFAGFFAYFAALLILVNRSSNFDTDWFLDGRRKAPQPPYSIPGDVAPTIHPFLAQGHGFAGAPGGTQPPSPPPHAESQGGFTAQAASSLAAPRDLGLDPDAVAACSAVPFTDAAGIDAFFPGGFIAWYNKTLRTHPAFAHRGAIASNATVAGRFTAFWNQIPTVFGAPGITAIEFCALMCIGIQENAGNLWANPEGVGNANHPGLAYAFDAIPGLKASYNHVGGNVSAFRLFQDPVFLDRHGGLPGASAVLGHGVSSQWDGVTWPPGFPTAPNPAVNGFVMEADFYKFRGRGVIQTTGRDAYKAVAAWILESPAAQAVSSLAHLAQAWRGASPGLTGAALLDAVATRSTNADWDGAFAETVTLAAAINIDSARKGNFLALSHDPAVLAAGTSTPGSLYYMARRINAGSYPATVVPMMHAMIAAAAAVDPSRPFQRAPRSFDS